MESDETWSGLTGFGSGGATDVSPVMAITRWMVKDGRRDEYEYRKKDVTVDHLEHSTTFPITFQQ